MHDISNINTIFHSSGIFFNTRDEGREINAVCILYT